jgi:hypothetical protein
MSDSEPIYLFGADRKPAHPPSQAPWARRKTPKSIAFSRRELNTILNIYGRKVAAGEWRDYAIDALKEKAVFSIFRHSSEMPLYRIVKQPRTARKPGIYAVIAPTGLILRRGANLPHVLQAIATGPHLVVA